MTTPALPPFIPPSPGAWELERTHATRPVSRFMAAVFPKPMVRGFAEATKTYGAMLDYMELAMINGLMYIAARPVGAPKGAKGPPPKPLFWLIQHLHPEIRRRTRRADEVFKEKYWRKELEWWDKEVKPDIAREGQALLADDLSKMSDDELARHITRATAFMDKTIYFHHRMNVCALLPPADFISHVMAWTGEKPEKILLAMRGYSPLSAGASIELEAARRAILADPEAPSILAGPGSATEVLKALGARPDVAAPLRAYLETVGWRVMGGYDVADRHGYEHPELLVKILKAAVAKAKAPDTTTGSGIDALRARVPAPHQAEFDSILAEAQHIYRVRDERNFCSDSIGIGLARRALLAAGERLKSRGTLDDATHIVDASPDEVAELLAGRGPSKEEINARVKFRETTDLDSAPQRLGHPPSAPPPGDWFSGVGARRMQSAINVALSLMFDVPQKQEGQGTQLKGFGVSPGVFEGPARVILNIGNLPTIREGEVLVTPSTGPTFNVVLPLLRGLVTERGGALSHAAIVAREYGIPGIVGCRDATTRVKTGQRIRVDGTKGEVWILG